MEASMQHPQQWSLLTLCENAALAFEVHSSRKKRLLWNELSPTFLLPSNKVLLSKFFRVFFFLDL